MLIAHYYSLRVTGVHTLAKTIVVGVIGNALLTHLHCRFAAPWLRAWESFWTTLKRWSPPLLPIRPCKRFHILYNILFYSRFPIKNFRYEH